MSLRSVGVGPVCLAAGMLLIARVWLLIAPGRAVKWSTARADRLPKPYRHFAIFDRIPRAIAGVGARWPFNATCLEQGLAFVMLLAMAGLPARLVIGVGRESREAIASGERSAPRAHAWVEIQGHVVFGGAQAHGLVPLT